MARHAFTPCVLWQAADGYDSRLVAVSADGLRNVVHSYLVSTRLFDHPGGAWIGEYRDTLPGHLHRAATEQQ